MRLSVAEAYMYGDFAASPEDIKAILDVSHLRVQWSQCLSP